MSTPVNDTQTTAADDLARCEHDRRERAWIPEACIAEERRKR